MSLTVIKKSLRQHYRHLRRELSLEHKTFSSQVVSHIFFNHFVWIPRSRSRDDEPVIKKNDERFIKKNIAVYLAFDGEIDLHYLIEALWQTDHLIFLPALHPHTHELSFVRYCPSTIMKKNQYGILEPENATECISPEDLDVVLMPLVAFDYKGTRLGMGKGYYDKSFAFCRSSPVKPMLVGVAYECQYCETLPANAWDVPLDGIMTEKKFILLGER